MFAPGSCSKLRPRPWRFTVNEYGPGPIVLRFSDLRDQLIPSVFRNIKRDVDARPDTFALEEQNVLSPEDLFLDGDLPLCGDGFVRALFYFDLRGVTVRQTRSAIRRLRLVSGNPELVPECHGTEEVFALFERAAHCAVVVVRPTGVLDVERQLFGEGYRIGDVPLVRGHARAEVGAIGDGDTEIRAIGNAQRPRVVEVIFRSRALNVCLPFAVDVEEIVTLAEPSGLILNHAQHGADVMTAAGGVKDFVGAPSAVGSAWR